MNERSFKNLILKSLDAETVARLSPQPVTFEVEHQIEFPGDVIQHVYFVEEGMASMTTTFSDGAQVEVGKFGYESIIGVSAIMGTKRSLNRVYTQIAGHGYSCSLEAARREFNRGGVFQSLALRYVQTQLVHAMQSAGCNAQHELDQRCSSALTAHRTRPTRCPMNFSPICWETPGPQSPRLPQC